MKYPIKIPIVLMLLSIQTYAQTIVPHESTPIDEEKVEECVKMIDNIDAMQLKVLQQHIMKR